MQKTERREAARAYKERTPEAGVYSLRCQAAGRQWIGISRNLGASRNSTAFSLKLGQFREPEVQEEFNAHGAAAFEFSVLEVLPEDTPALLLRDLLKDRRAHWQQQLGAGRLL